ncbi:Eco57I restriction-modification methylase domain-containing protein [Gloeobacter kilaueensis]|uniref:site-specific DNA-methyltransferase (adenine-specific) n=1 Tax=Gloeobacter kilaueensis (strain ATCC BAA-2537 / CCAP 1431/1 / ULC 316 / JS1) TaxID=1183438 RepID=U5QLK7_GLOK1|nr:N-6 DNA methylase [Gloeobacter kilaueensis]AGY58565.1 N5-glutamine S-adenosyl-L-methionine-dependent methyltransferase [Gloeobacter kilaueensis JS1]
MGGRFQSPDFHKAQGATYTPAALADFVAEQIVRYLPGERKRPLRILDPALGDGQLLVSLLAKLGSEAAGVTLHGYETDTAACERARARLAPAVLTVEGTCFLDVASEKPTAAGPFDIVIANPPYVRTQILGSDQSRALARRFGLTGRLDLYQAFVLGIAGLLAPTGVAGLILSNRFMSIRAGASVRRALSERFQLRAIWDLGDTQLFAAAVLPAVVLLEGTDSPITTADTPFSSIYRTSAAATGCAASPLAALNLDGVVEVTDGRRFEVRHGTLAPDPPGALWRMTTGNSEHWLARVRSRTWKTFGELGKIRVGVKTCADSVFIRSDWQEWPPEERPELLKPLATHHGAGRFRANSQTAWQIVYPHQVVAGRRVAVPLDAYPRTARYLEKHRQILIARSYLLAANRQWYELWVPQDPDGWAAPKLVFRDIVEEPTFWLDETGSVVNGDCYWLRCDKSSERDALWLALAVGNSSFIAHFYDHCFHNKLYAGRRRFMSQYVEKFPLPRPDRPQSRQLVGLAQQIYSLPLGSPVAALERQLDALVWQAFDLDPAQSALAFEF